MGKSRALLYIPGLILQAQTPIPCGETSPLPMRVLVPGSTGWVIPELCTRTMLMGWIWQRLVWPNCVWKVKSGGYTLPSEKLHQTQWENQHLTFIIRVTGWVFPQFSFLIEAQEAACNKSEGARLSCNVYHLTRVKVSSYQLQETSRARRWFAPKARGEQISRWVQRCPLMSIWIKRLASWTQDICGPDVLNASISFKETIRENYRNIQMNFAQN